LRFYSVESVDGILGDLGFHASVSDVPERGFFNDLMPTWYAYESEKMI
jgi:hypothetical protein